MSGRLGREVRCPPEQAISGVLVHRVEPEQDAAACRHRRPVVPQFCEANRVADERLDRRVEDLPCHLDGLDLAGRRRSGAVADVGDVERQDGFCHCPSGLVGVDATC